MPQSLHCIPGFALGLKMEEDRPCNERSSTYRLYLRGSKSSWLHTKPAFNNDTNARYSGILSAGIGPNAGGDPRYVGVGLRHLF